MGRGPARPPLRPAPPGRPSPRGPTGGPPDAPRPAAPGARRRRQAGRPGGCRREAPMTPAARPTPGLAGASGLRPLLGEVNDLKRIVSAGRPGSLAARGFARAWAALVAGEPPDRVAHLEAAAA